jgi:DNA invertase Pin-like site-specific DNA recombinase
VTAKLTAREYLRVSADKSGTLRSPQEQHADNAGAASREGWALGEPYRENGAVSASRYGHKARHGFDALVTDLAADRFGAQVLMLWESSRGSRRVGEWATLLDHCQDHGVLIHVTSHHRTYDPARPRDRRTLMEDAVDAEYESGKVSERVTRAMAANAAAGEPHGRVPYGFKREYDLTPAGKRILRGQFRDPAVAPVIEHIYDQIRELVSLRAIAATLNSEGIPAPGGGRWTPTAVRDLALNPAYAGQRIHVAGRRSGHDRTKDGTLVKATWKGIVSEETFFAVRAILTDPRRRTSRPGRDKHLLSMIAICDVCDGPLSIRYRRGSGEYACRNSGHVHIPQAELDIYIEAAILSRFRGKDAYPAMTTHDRSPELQSARDEKAAIEAHYLSMKRQLRERRMTPEAFAEVEPGVLADLAKAQKRVRELEAPPALQHLLGDPGESIDTRWDALPMAARREVVRIVFERLSLKRAPSPGHRAHVGKRTDMVWNARLRW